MDQSSVLLVSRVQASLTLVRCINLLERPTSGTIKIDGRDITQLAGKELLEVPGGSVGVTSPEFPFVSAAHCFAQCNVSS